MFSLKVIWNPLEGLDLGFFTLHFYSLSYVIAFTLGWYIIKPIFKNEGMSFEKLDPLFMYTVIGCLVGARLGHYLFYEPITFIEDPARVFLPFRMEPEFEWTGFAGMASHGAAIGIIIAMYFYSKKHTGKHMFWILDRIVIPTAIGGTFVRLGNLMNSEINGKATDMWSGFKFVRDTSDPAVKAALQQTGMPNADQAIQALVNDPQYSELLASIPYKHPAQLYEAICYVFVFLALYLVYWKTNKGQKLGYILGLFFVLLFTVRLIIEQIKEPQTSTDGFEFLGIAFNTGQLLSVPFILLGLYLMFKPSGWMSKDSPNKVS